MQGIDRVQRRPQPLVIGVELQHQFGELVGIGGQVRCGATAWANRTKLRAASPRVDLELSDQNWLFYDRRSCLRPCQSVEQQCQLRR